jgi:hypothetical protein
VHGIVDDKVMDISRISCDEACPIRHKVVWPNKALHFCKLDGVVSVLLSRGKHLSWLFFFGIARASFFGVIYG